MLCVGPCVYTCLHFVYMFAGASSEEISDILCITHASCWISYFTVTAINGDQYKQTPHIPPCKSLDQTCPRTTRLNKISFRGLQSESCHLCFDISGGHVLVHIPDQSSNYCRRDTLLSDWQIVWSNTTLKKVIMTLKTQGHTPPASSLTYPSYIITTLHSHCPLPSSVGRGKEMTDLFSLLIGKGPWSREFNAVSLITMDWLKAVAT